jgi:hypothetical protein
MALVRHARRMVTRLGLATALAGSMLAAPLAVSATDGFTIVSVIPIDIVLDGCEEPIALSGTLRDVLHVTELPSGAVTFVAVTSSANITGVGLVTGDSYRGVGVTLQPFHASALSDDATLEHLLTSTLVDRTRIVGTGGAMTLEFKLTFHVTKVDEVPMVIFERGAVTCT